MSMTIKELLGSCSQLLWVQLDTSLHSIGKRSESPTMARVASACYEKVRDGVDGRLVPSHDETALGSALIEVLSDAALRERMSANARNRVAERFRLGDMIEAYEQVLAGVVRRKMQARGSRAQELV